MKGWPRKKLCPWCRVPIRGALVTCTLVECRQKQLRWTQKLLGRGKAATA